MAVRILLVDPQPFFCEALQGALETAREIDMVAWTTDEEDATHLAADFVPELVLTELELDRGSGLSLVRRLHDHTRVVILTRRQEGEVLPEVIAAGADGCLGHSMDVRELVPVVLEAAEGRFVLAQNRLRETLSRALGPHEERSPVLDSGLTAREREVLRLLARGYDDNKIAQSLFMSVHTARTHVGRILRKLQVHSRADAARLSLSADSHESAVVLRIEGPDLGTA